MTKTTKKKPTKKRKVGRPRIFETPAELQNLIDDYFKQCDKEKRPYTITGLALYLNIERDTISNYGKIDEFFGTIKKAKMRVLQSKEERLDSGRQVAGIIFDLKNNYSEYYSDRHEITGKDGEGLKITIVYPPNE